MNGTDTPDRVKLVVDLREGRLAAGSVTRSLAGPTPTPNQVLATYLSLVYTLRHAEPGTPITLRSGDLDVLAEVLRLSEGDVERRLTGLMADPSGEISHRTRMLRGRVVIPVAGILIAVTAVGALLLVVDGDAADEPQGTPVSSELVKGANASVGAEPSDVTATTQVIEIPNADGSTTRAVIGDDLRPEDLGPGDVGLAPPVVIERGPNGEIVQTEPSSGDGESTTTTTA